ncbi:hypothetical protein B0I35DRAFT_202680 [Stachybotrys elegans]|uniref:BZIP domain-containing protein n=1 Tax=Stachybotrys elegans TaxID=80388 RepID=A0A8K0SVH0_9HYPO|nr:hypothetical protein B0I35DRAFT_202680 [Stachybotrys elegans]
MAPGPPDAVAVAATAATPTTTTITTTSSATNSVSVPPDPKLQLSASTSTAATPEATTPIPVHAKRDASSPPPSESVLSKKKKTGSGSRGVASLTPEQLAKKRANDREAQRAIRERTKNQIENYERRIQELTNQQPYQELQAVIRAKEAVEQENAELRRTLAKIVGIIQPMIGGPSEAVYVSPAQTYAQAVPNHPPAPSMPVASASPSVASPGSFDGQSHTTQTSLDYSKMQLNQQRHDLRHGLEIGHERLTFGMVVDSNQTITKIPNGINGAQDTPQYRHAPMKHDLAASSHEQAFQYSRQVSWSPTSSATPANVTNHQSSMAVATVKNSRATCPLDTLLLDFLRERRQRVAEGLSTQETIGPRYPSVSSLLNPAQSAYSHPLSKFFTDILATFPDISTLPERVAVLYVMFLYMRWQISPTQENFDRLPDWIAPRPIQLTHSHAAWIDMVPFPSMREKLIETFDVNENVFEHFFVPFTTTLTLNWPYEETDCLLMNPDSDEIVINPVFERHLRRLENWRLGEAFATAFPHLRDTCFIYSPSPGRPGSR